MLATRQKTDRKNIHMHMHITSFKTDKVNTVSNCLYMKDLDMGMMCYPRHNERGQVRHVRYATSSLWRGAGERGSGGGAYGKYAMSTALAPTFPYRLMDASCYARGLKKLITPCAYS